MNGKVITLNDLSKINYQMLGKGVPNSKDNIGYNRPDYYACSKYSDKLLFIEAADICKRFKKYHNTQLMNIIDHHDIAFSEKFYLYLSKDISSKNSFNSSTAKFIVQNNMIYLYFKYDKEVYLKVKELQGIWDGEKWLINFKYFNVLKKFLNNIEYNLIDIDSSFNKNKFSDIYNNSEDMKQVKLPIIKVTEFGDLVHLNFKYDERLVSVIRSLPKCERKYDDTTKSWILSFLALEILIYSDVIAFFDVTEINNVLKKF